MTAQLSCKRVCVQSSYAYNNVALGEQDRGIKPKIRKMAFPKVWFLYSLLKGFQLLNESSHFSPLLPAQD